MFEPLRDLRLAESCVSASYNTAAPLFVSDEELLGERAGRLYGSSDRDAYLRRGGVAYPTVKLANVNVVDKSGRDGKHRAGGFAYASSHPSSGLIRAGVEVPRRVISKALRAAAYVLPVMRVAFPFAVPRPSIDDARRAAAALYPEQVTAVALHPHLMLMAVAVHEGGRRGECRVCVYDIVEDKLLAVLTHAFQVGVAAMEWKPFSRDVLAVGCHGGVLLWSLTAGETTMTTATTASEDSWSSTAHAVFYRCMRGVPVTAMNFSCKDGRYLVCGSASHTRMKVLDTCLGPQESGCTVASAVPSIEGGVQSALFADDDTYILSTVCAAPFLCMTHLSSANCSTVSVATPAPVRQVVKAPGVGVNYYFLYTDGLEGVLLARANAHVGLEVISLISTSLCRGVGGAVRGIAASRRRLWVILETGHVLFCHYTCRDGAVALVPVGAAAMDAERICSFEGCTSGSLLAVVDRAGGICFVPSYHR